MSRTVATFYETVGGGVVVEIAGRRWTGSRANVVVVLRRFSAEMSRLGKNTDAIDTLLRKLES